MDKNFKAILLVNWKTGKMRVIKRKVIRYSPWEVAIDVNLNVTIPDNDDMYKLTGNIIVPKVQVNEMMIESLCGDDADGSS